MSFSMGRSRASWTTAAVLLLAAFDARAASPTTPECLAASDASLKLGNDHKLRAERAQLLVCADASCPADIRLECARRVDEVNAQVPTLIFAAKDASGADLSAVKVTMDGEVLAERLEGAAFSIDPGEHTFTFETPGQAPVTKTLIIQEAQKDRHESVVFGTPASTGAPLPPGEPPLSSDVTSAQGGYGMSAQRVLALVAGGIGVVGLGIGTAFGVMAISKKSDAESACPGTPCATQTGSNRWSDAASTGNVSTVGFIVGGVGIAGGLVLWLTAKPSSDRALSAQVGLGVGAIQVRGRW
jgi:hypothetical protein